MDNKIFIISGKKGSGKTTFLKEAIKFLKETEIQVGGIVAEGYWRNNQRESFDLINQTTGDKIVFCQRDEVENWDKIRHFYLNPKGQKFGEASLKTSNLKNCDLVVIDELGPFELEGKGWSFALKKLISHSNLPMIWVIREGLENEILNYFSVSSTKIFSITEDTPKKLIEIIITNI